MATQVLTKKIIQLENKIVQLEQLNNPAYSQVGLHVLYGMWKQQPRTKKDLRVVRKKLGLL